MWIEKLVNVNPVTRPGTKLKGVRKIVEHYTANPGASAYNHYKYFNGTAIQQKRYASAHIFVDKVEAYLIIPLDEVAYHANDGTYRGVPELKPNANLYSIGVELCIEKDGTFHPETLRRAAEINAELCKRFKLDPHKDIVRHYDVTHKNCPARWVQHPEEFTEFKNMVNVVLNPPKDGIGIAISKYPEGYGVNYYNAPNGSYRGKITKKTPYPVYQIKNGYIDIGEDRWIPEESMDVTRYTATSRFKKGYGVNYYSAPNGSYKGKITNPIPYKVYNRIDGWVDIGQNKWIPEENMIIK